MYQRDIDNIKLEQVLNTELTVSELPSSQTIAKPLVGRSASKTPLEMCWYLRNFFGTTSNRYDKADECGIFLCEMLMPYVANDKMVDDVDDDCTQYWGKVIQYLKDGR